MLGRYQSPALMEAGCFYCPELLPVKSPKCYDEHGVVVPADCVGNYGYIAYPNDNSPA